MKTRPSNAMPSSVAPTRWVGVSRQGAVLTALLVALILVCVIALLSASVFGVLQQRKKAGRIGGRYSPEFQQSQNDQDQLLEQAPHWKVKLSEDSRTLVIPIEMAMQSVVRQYGMGSKQER